MKKRVMKAKEKMLVQKSLKIDPCLDTRKLDEKLVQISLDCNPSKLKFNAE